MGLTGLSCYLSGGLLNAVNVDSGPPASDAASALQVVPELRHRFQMEDRWRDGSTRRFRRLQVAEHLEPPFLRMTFLEVSILAEWRRHDGSYRFSSSRFLPDRTRPRHVTRPRVEPRQARLRTVRCRIASRPSCPGKE